MLTSISLAIPFIFFNDINAFLPLSGAVLRYKRVVFDCSKSNWGMGRILPHRRIPGSQK